MKFVELKKSLKSKIYNNYLLTGNDAFLLNKSLELITDAINPEPKDLNYHSFTENINFENVVKALNTLPIFSEYKLIYVNHSIKPSSLDNIEEFISYLKNPNPQSVLVLNIAENKKEFQKIMQYFEVVDCNKLNRDLTFSFVVAELKKYNKTITPKALVKLCEYSLFDLNSINAEVLKLVGYIGERAEVSESDVDLNVTKNLDYQIFDLTENLAKKNADKVYELLADIRAKKDNDKVLLPLIYNHFRRLFHVSLSPGNKRSLSDLLKVKEYAITVAANQVKFFTQRQLKKINDLCLELDFAVKSNSMTNDSAINFLVLELLNL